MHHWRHPWLVLTAFLAIFSSLLPSQGWSCPMTGRVGSAAFVCPEMAQECAEPGQTCCQPVMMGPKSLSPGEETIAAPTAPVFAPQFDRAVTSLPAARFAFKPQAAPESSPTRRAAPNFHFSSRHGPALWFGRAPPLNRERVSAFSF